MSAVTYARHSHARRTPESPIMAALDLGTNNCRLMLASQDGARMRVLERFSSIVRLGEGMETTGRLSERAQDRTIDALIECAATLKAYEVQHGWYVTTEACRRATNGANFIARVKAETGIPLNLISHKDEAVLAFLGCSPLIDSSADVVCMIDIGGGSTEMMVVDMTNPLKPHMIAWNSFPFGVMTLSEKMFASGEPDIDSCFASVMNEMKAFLDKPAIMELIQKPATQLLCTSGTATTLAAIQQGLPRYSRMKIDGLTLSQTQWLWAIEYVYELTHEQRLEHPCIGPERSDFILAGTVIMESVLRLVPTDMITVADRGLREGILFSLFQKYAP